VQFIDKLAFKRKDAVILIRIISGHMNTNNRSFKMGLIESLDYNGFSSQDLNYLFWACPLLTEQRQKLCSCL